jgi:hypothetical protein
MSQLELQSVVKGLAIGELEVFAQWFEEYFADLWDRRIEADSLAGRLDQAGQKADAEFESGRCTPL